MVTILSLLFCRVLHIATKSAAAIRRLLDCRLQRLVGCFALSLSIATAELVDNGLEPVIELKRVSVAAL
jgi:hypothetical protein